jgi:hypothetical protein
MADKFFEQVEEELANKSSQKVAENPGADHVEVPPSTAASPATGAEQGMVSVTSNPDGADVSVDGADGAFVGNAPAELKLSPGKHTISVAQTGFSTWSNLGLRSFR